jgi:hypothetical protein
MTVQAQIKALLSKSGIPAKEIEVYGSQIVITSAGEASARKWAALIAKFAKIRGVIEAYDEVKQPTTGTCLHPQMVKVWRVFAAIQ